MGIVTRLAKVAAVFMALIAAPLWADCGIAPAGTSQRIAIPGTGRAMLIHLPAQSDTRRPAPLLFLFHGSGGTGERMLAKSNLAATADAHGFILAVPDGGITLDGGFVWNIPGVPTPSGAMPGADDPDDIAYVLAAIDWLRANRCINSGRIYAAGFSGGGRMASLLGCVAADRFAAIAPVAGLRAGLPAAQDPTRPDPASCKPARPMPIITFAGDKDTENPIEGGGSAYWQYSMRAALDRWAMLNGCAPTPIRRGISTQLYEERFGHCRQGADIVVRMTIGGTHSWLADNETMWTFFSRHRRKS
ncbi:alpha/beta hydrolase family esterase [Sphingomonas sp. MMS24-J13]|uniref:alpha/beta hydrolase family esterase n=1 Tax=Sphingomonas sp. MMS24-J13 TaxID=3238686 RepID=UPI00384F427B